MSSEIRDADLVEVFIFGTCRSADAFVGEFEERSQPKHAKSNNAEVAISKCASGPLALHGFPRRGNEHVFIRLTTFYLVESVDAGRRKSVCHRCPPHIRPILRESLRGLLWRSEHDAALDSKRSPEPQVLAAA